ncbi:hypothetical protein, partial [Paraburkholderia sp. BR14374]|uniref:hypothetical protein n=1 Tax=Paraburkholderia sp. BR14374 TaxID=3237007 RepID=UPI0034CD558B
MMSVRRAASHFLTTAIFATALAAVAAAMAVSAHAQNTTTVSLGTPGYFNLTDPKTTSTLIQ